MLPSSRNLFIATIISTLLLLIMMTHSPFSSSFSSSPPLFFVDAAACPTADCASGTIALANCDWSDDNCGFTRKVNNMNLDNVHVIEMTSSNWTLKGNANVTWSWSNVAFSACPLYHTIDIIIDSPAISSVNVNLDNITFVGAGCISNRWVINIVSNVGRPIDLQVNLRNISLLLSTFRIGVNIAVPTVAGSRVSLQDSFIARGFFKVNATDIAIDMNNVTLVDLISAIEPIVGLNLVSAYRPQMMPLGGMGPAIPNMNATITDCVFNVSSADFIAEKGIFKFQNSQLTQLSSTADYGFTWQTELFVPANITMPPMMGNMTKPVNVITFECHNTNFYDARMRIITAGRYRFIHYNTLWIGRHIVSSPRVVNSSIDEYLLDVEIRNSRFFGKPSAISADEGFIFDFWSSFEVSSTFWFPSTVSYSACQGTSDLSPMNPMDKRIKVNSFVEDSVLDMVYVRMSFPGVKQSEMCWGCLNAPSGSTCDISDALVNFRFARSEVRYTSFADFFLPNATLQLEVDSPINNVSTENMFYDGQGSTISADTIQFFVRNIPNNKSGPVFHCPAGSSSPSCQDFGFYVKNTRFIFENARNVGFTMKQANYLTRSFEVIPLGRYQNSIEIRGSMLNAPPSSEEQDGKQTRHSPFNASSIYFYVPFTGNTSFANLNLDFIGADISHQTFVFDNPIDAGFTIPFQFTLPFQSHTSWGSINVRSSSNTILNDAQFRHGTTAYNGITYNITDTMFDGNSIVFNESMCDWYPNTPVMNSVWNTFYAKNSRIRSGGRGGDDPMGSNNTLPDSDRGYYGLIQDFTTCAGFNLFFNTINVTHESKWNGATDTFLYSQFKMANIFPGKYVVMKGEKNIYNGTMTRLTNYAMNPEDTFEKIQDYPVAGGLFFECDGCSFDLALPTSTIVQQNPSFIPQFAIFDNFPGGNISSPQMPDATSGIVLKNSKFMWNSGGAPFWVNQMDSEGGSTVNGNYTETRTFVRGFTPPFVIMNNTEFSVYGTNMTRFNLVSGAANSPSRAFSFMMGNSQLSVSTGVRDRSSEITLIVFASFCCPLLLDGGLELIFRNSHISIDAYKVNIFWRIEVLPPLIDTVPAFFFASNTTFNLASDASRDPNTANDAIATIFDWSTGTLAPTIQLIGCNFNFDIRYFNFYQFRAFRLHQSYPNGSKFYMTGGNKIHFNITNASTFYFLKQENFFNYPLANDVIINQTTFTAEVHGFNPNPNSERFEAVMIRINALSNDVTMGPQVNFNISWPMPPGTLITLNELLRVQGADGATDNISGTILLQNITMNSLAARGALFAGEKMNNFNVMYRNIIFTAQDFPTTDASDGSRQHNVGDLEMAGNSAVDVDNVNAHISSHGSNLPFIVSARANSSLMIKNSKFIQNTFFVPGATHISAVVVWNNGNLSQSSSNVTIVNTTVRSHMDMSFIMSVIAISATTCEGNALAPPSSFDIIDSDIQLSFNAYTPGLFAATPVSLISAGRLNILQQYDLSCAKLSVSGPKSLVRIDDNRGLVSGSYSSSLISSNIKVQSVTVADATLVLPQFVTLFVADGGVGNGIVQALLDHTRIKFIGAKPAETTIFSCIKTETSCPYFLKISNNVIQHSISIGEPPIKRNTNITTGIVNITCNYANDRLWQPSVASIKYSSVFVDPNRALCHNPRTESRTMTIEPEPTTTTNVSTNTSTTTTTTSSTTETPTTSTTLTNTTSTSTTSTTTTTTPITTTATIATTTTTFTTTASPPSNITVPATKPPQVQEAQRVQEDTTSAVSAVGASAGLLGMAAPTLATVAARAGIISKLASCEPSLDEELPRFISPTGLELDLGAPEVRYHVGALVANMAILIGFTFLSFIYAVIHSKCFAKPEERRVFGIAYRSLGAARFPSGIIFFLMFFSQPFIGSSLVSIFYGNTATACLSVFVILFTIGCVVFLAMILRDDKNFLATYRTREEVEFDRQFSIKERKLKGLPEEEEEPQGSCEKFDKWYERVVEGVSGFWFDVPRPDEELDFATREKIDMKRIQNHEGHKYFQLRFGGAFDYYQSKYRWFIVLEVCASLVLGVCDGLVDLISCDNVAFILVALFGLYVATVLVIRPFASRKDLFFCGLVSLLQFVGGILTVLPAGTIGDAEKQESAIIIVCSTALFVGIVQAVEGLLSDGLRFVADKLSKTHEAPINYNTVTATAVVLHERHGGGAEESTPTSINEKEVALAEHRQASGEVIPTGGLLQVPVTHLEYNNNNNNKASSSFSHQQHQPHRQAASTTLPQHQSTEFADMPLSARQKAMQHERGEDSDDQYYQQEQEMRPVSIAVPTISAVASKNYNKDDMDEL